MEANYRDLVFTLGNAEAATLSEDSAYLASVAMRPSALSVNYWLNTRITGSPDFISQGRAMFCATAELAAGINYMDKLVVLANGLDLFGIETGTAALIGEEVVRIDAYDALTQTLTIARGCADTVPAKHAASTRIWFYESAVVYDTTEYSTGTGLDVKLQPITTQAEMPLDDVAQQQITFSGRQARPFPPGRFQINGEREPDEVIGTMTVSWAHRNRIIQAEHLIDTETASITPEEGTTYTIRLLRTDSGAVITEQTGITGTTVALLSTYTGEVRLELFSVRDGLQSWQKHEAVFNAQAGAATESITWDSTTWSFDQDTWTFDKTEI